MLFSLLFQKLTYAFLLMLETFLMRYSLQDAKIIMIYYLYEKISASALSFLSNLTSFLPLTYRTLGNSLSFTFHLLVIGQARP